MCGHPLSDMAPPVSLPTASVGVQCFYCNGVTRYDPNNCWHPSEENTILMECAKGDWCEVRTHAHTHAHTWGTAANKHAYT